MRPHGRSKYLHEKCRCDICRHAATVYMRKRRANMHKRLEQGEVEGLAHGTVATYGNWGCRCVDCTEAKRLANHLYGR